MRYGELDLSEKTIAIGTGGPFLTEVKKVLHNDGWKIFGLRTDSTLNSVFRYMLVTSYVPGSSHTNDYVIVKENHTVTSSSSHEKGEYISLSLIDNRTGLEVLTYSIKDGELEVLNYPKLAKEFVAELNKRGHR